MAARSHPPLLRWPGADERTADRLDELASGLDAGLTPDALLPGDPAATTVERLATRLRLGVAERAQLTAAEAAGRLPAALRDRAHERRQRASMTRDVLRRLPYLGLLVVMAVLVAVIAGRLTRASWGTPLVVFALGVGVPLLGLLALRRALRNPAFTGRGLPGLAPLLRDLGETAYLEAVAGQYAAGIDLVTAHTTALQTVPVASVRAGLFRAQQELERGSGFGESLARAGALGSETMQLLIPGEASGTLEEAMRRALERRRFTLSRRLQRAARLATVVLQIAVYGFCAWQILSFYSAYYGMLR